MATATDNDARVTLFQSIGLNEQKARETLKNVEVTRLLETTINEVFRFFLFFFYSTTFSFGLFKAKTHLTKGKEIPKSIGNLLYTLSTRSKQQIHHLHRHLIKYICDEKIKTELQLLGKEKTTVRFNKMILFFFLAAIDHLLTNPVEPVDVKALEENAGIGVTVTSEDIERVVEEVLEQHKKELLEQRYSFAIGTLLGEVRKRLKWADGKAVKNEMDVQVRRKFFISNGRRRRTNVRFSLVTRSFGSKGTNRKSCSSSEINGIF